MNELEKEIFRTIAWFDIFDYPLTAWEIYKWGYFKKPNVSYQASEIKEKLEKNEELKKLISQKHGFYFLKWRDDLVKIRKERYLLAEKKYRKLKKISQVLKIMPFVRGMAVATGLSYFNSKENDDIDLFIITQKSKIWTSRFFLILTLKIFRLRPNPRNKKNKICLNFLIDQNQLDLRGVMLPEEFSWPDIYFIYWLAWLYPIFQMDDSWLKFLEANNWLHNFLPFSSNQRPSARFSLTLGRAAKILKTMTEKIFYFKIWEKIFCWFQMKIMPSQLKGLANKNSSVIIKNSMLKLHDQDRRQKYREKFYEKIKQIN